MFGAEISGCSDRSILGFLMVIGLALLGPACGGGQLSSPDGALAAACMLSFDPGPCRAAFPVYAFVDGACVPRTYGGCDGNANRFGTLEDCLAVCEGRPVPNACPVGRTPQQICLACGPAGGCSHLATVCALVCQRDGGGIDTCPSELPICHEGVCQNAYCD